MATVTFNDNPVSSTVSSDRYDFIVISGEKIHPEREPVNLTTTVSYMQAFKDGETTTFAAYYPVIFSASDPLTVRGNITHIFSLLRILIVILRTIRWRGGWNPVHFHEDFGG